MQFKCIACFSALLLLWHVALAEETSVPANDPLTIVLRQSLETPEIPYFLQVNCTDQKGIRSMSLFPGGAAIWNGRSQIILPPSARSDLLEALVDWGFSGFEDSYGGHERPEKSAAPARINCQIRIEIQRLEKSSVHMAGGKQSSQFLGLATALLDKAGQYKDSAITPVDMRDALNMLDTGQLLPQMLRLRFMQLPEKNSTEAGFILRISGKQLSRQVYSPGHQHSGPVAEPLNQDQFSRLISSMRTEQFDSFPTNLWSDELVEIEVEILAHKKVVLARRFMRMESAGEAPVQQRFENLLVVLRELAR